MTRLMIMVAALLLAGCEKDPVLVPLTLTSEKPIAPKECYASRSRLPKIPVVDYSKIPPSERVRRFSLDRIDDRHKVAKAFNRNLYLDSVCRGHVALTSRRK